MPYGPDRDAFGDPLPTLTSDKQVAANRLNAQHSTGPRTARGSSHSTFNALRHGLYARDVVFPDEDRAAYDALVASLKADLAPEGQVEHGLVSRAADIWWRLGRTAAIEAGFLNPNWSGDPRTERFKTGGGPLIDGFRVALDDTRTLDRLGRYEARLERALSRTFAMLHRLQETRLRLARVGAEDTGPKKTVIEK